LSTVNEALHEGRLLYMPEVGVVVRVDDPEGRHRVKFMIPNLVEPESQWARPLGGGGPQRGGHVCPRVGDEVVVTFLGGDVERPVYQAAWWGDGEEPEDLAALSVADAPLVQVLEFARHAVAVDERPGREQLVLRDKLTGDSVTLDGVTGTVTVQATTALVLRAVGAVSIEGAAVTVNGRPVLADPAGM
jgi:uncharacterized protein involved in type VI secretion and phage assembly